jgi:ubiquitin carboxyl-terminal hydrolase 8
LFLQGNWRASISRGNALGTGGRVAEAFADLVSRAWSRDAGSLSPSQLKESVGAIASQFAGCDEQDSQELLAFIIDALHEDLNGNGAAAKNDSPIVPLFHGQLRSRVVCPKCQRDSVTLDTFSTLPLPIRDARDLGACLSIFAEEDRLDSQNKWRCTSCSEDVSAVKKIAIWTAPRCLIVHLKKFTADRKIDRDIDYPFEIDLTPYVLGPQRSEGALVYQLYAVSEHSGNLRGGHYTAHARVGDRWYLFDDSSVRLSDNARNQNAYILCYERKDAS